MSDKIRCQWAGDTQIYINYHDVEWGRPIHDDRKLFEMLMLESMQAGLSWITILKKREAYRCAFDNFNPYKIATYDEKKIDELMNDAGIVRNKLKIKAAINNAQKFIEIVDIYGSFDKLIWSYVDNTPIVGNWSKISEVPATTEISDKISKDLKKFGFKFLGSTTIYAFMQAAGLVNDHIKECFVYDKIQNEQNRIY